MTRDNGGVVDSSGPLQAAREDHAAVVKLTRELVRIPRRGGIDPYDPVVNYMASWLAEHDLLCRRLAGPGGTTLTLTCEITGAGPGRATCWTHAWIPPRSVMRTPIPALTTL